MEFTKEEVAVIAQTISREQQTEFVELLDSQLLLVGGGAADCGWD